MCSNQKFILGLFLTKWYNIIIAHGLFPKTGNFGRSKVWELSIPSERAPSKLSENCWILITRTLVTEPTTLVSAWSPLVSQSHRSTKCILMNLPDPGGEGVHTPRSRECKLKNRYSWSHVWSNSSYSNAGIELRSTWCSTKKDHHNWAIVEELLTQTALRLDKDRALNNRP